MGRIYKQVCDSPVFCVFAVLHVVVCQFLIRQLLCIICRCVCACVRRKRHISHLMVSLTNRFDLSSFPSALYEPCRVNVVTSYGLLSLCFQHVSNCCVTSVKCLWASFCSSTSMIGVCVKVLPVINDINESEIWKAGVWQLGIRTRVGRERQPYPKKLFSVTGNWILWLLYYKLSIPVNTAWRHSACHFGVKILLKCYWIY